MKIPKRVHVIVVLLAWLMSTGAQWDLVQTCGWGRMIAKYAQIMPLAEAVKKTFGGELCGICKAVNDAKQDEQNTPTKAGQTDAKFVMSVQSVSVLDISATESLKWSLSDLSGRSFDRGAPPLPPPRVRVAC